MTATKSHPRRWGPRCGREKQGPPINENLQPMEIRYMQVQMAFKRANLKTLTGATKRGVHLLPLWNLPVHVKEHPLWHLSRVDPNYRTACLDYIDREVPYIIQVGRDSRELCEVMEMVSGNRKGLTREKIQVGHPLHRIEKARRIEMQIFCWAGECQPDILGGTHKFKLSMVEALEKLRRMEPLGEDVKRQVNVTFFRRETNTANASLPWVPFTSLDKTLPPRLVLGDLQSTKAITDRVLVFHCDRMLTDIAGLIKGKCGGLAFKPGVKFSVSSSHPGQVVHINEDGSFQKTKPDRLVITKVDNNQWGSFKHYELKDHGDGSYDIPSILVDSTKKVMFWA